MFPLSWPSVPCCQSPEHASFSWHPTPPKHTYTPFPAESILALMWYSLLLCVQNVFFLSHSSTHVQNSQQQLSVNFLWRISLWDTVLKICFISQHFLYITTSPLCDWGRLQILAQRLQTYMWAVPHTSIRSMLSSRKIYMNIFFISFVKEEKSAIPSVHYA